YDVTSSGITETWYNIEPNKNRIKEVIPQNNIGYLAITASDSVINIDVSLYDSTALPVVSHRISIDEISF
ncbi:MAG: hypothetical protein AAF206_26340, partial [Bacteroidota bacterium]